MSVVDWVYKKISLESASERLSAISISRQQVLPSKFDAYANVTTCCSLRNTCDRSIMVSKRALDLGHVRFGQEVNVAEVMEVENVETQDCEFISEKMSEAQRKDLCKELEKHPCLWETCGPEYKNKPQRSRALDLTNLTFHLTVAKNNYIALERH